MSDQKTNPEPFRFHELEFAWQREYRAWAEKETAEGRGWAKYTPGSRQTPLERVLRAAQEARQTPEVWHVVLLLNERRKLDPETELTEDERLLITDFMGWFMMKNGTYHTDEPFAYVASRWLLQEWAAGRIDEQDDGASRVWVEANNMNFRQQPSGNAQP